MTSRERRRLHVRGVPPEGVLAHADLVRDERWQQHHDHLLQHDLYARLGLDALRTFDQITPRGTPTTPSWIHELLTEAAS